MTSATTTGTAGTSGSGGVRRTLALARLEMTMLLRNKTALFNGLALGPLMVLFINAVSLPTAGADRGSFAAQVLGSLVVFALVFAAYYNLCTTAVARREELMLKRLTTGELTRGEVLVATAIPALSVVLAQVVLGGVAAVVVLGAPPLVSPLLPLLGLLLGFAALAVLGYATAIVTRTVESAQITTLLPLAALLLLSGATFPLELMPEPMRLVAELTPLAAVGELVALGLPGVDGSGAAVDLGGSFVAAIQPVLVLLAWTGLGGALVRSRMPWEPRR